MKTKFWIICLSIFFMACSRNMNDIYTGGGEEGEEKINKDDFFDFTTTRNNQFTIDYGMKIQTVFYLYDEYPMELVDNTWEFKDITPIYAASTDENGKFTSKVPLPGYLKKVWLVSDNVLVVSPIELELGVDGLTFNYTDYKAQLIHSRAVMDGITYPDGYDKLGDWSADGIPYYLLSDKQDIPTAFLKRCNQLANSVKYDMTPLLDKFPALQTSGTNDMVITKNTDLVATYFESSAGWKNMVAYYTYQENESVDLAIIKKTLLFPLYNKDAPKSLIGAQVKMKYWNKEMKTYQDDFPAGTHIGWILLGNSYGNKTPYKLRYSNPAYNADNGKQRSVLLSDSELDNCFFMAMEDNVDMRFNDVQFAIMASTPASVEPTPTIPDEVNKGEISYVVKGSLAYEDNWPDKDDYDMNDVVIYYSSTVVKDAQWNTLVRTTTTFTPMNDGATYTNGFGFQLDDVEKKDIVSVRVSQGGNIISEEFEPETEKPVLILFSNIKSVLKKPVTVVIEFAKSHKISEMDAYPPYNSFIFVNERSHEVHLSGYKPTILADESLRGTGSDLSQDSSGALMYYIAKDNMPFAINISNNDFKWPSEKVSITTYYPEFKQWRDSFGESHKDWYLHPGG